MRILTASIILLCTLILCSCESKSSSSNGTSPFISDGAVLVATVNGSQFKYPGSNPVQPSSGISSFNNGDSMVANSFFQLTSSNKSFTLQFISLKFGLGNDGQLSDQEFLQGIKPGYYNIGIGGSGSSKRAVIAYSDSTGWSTSGTQNGSSFYIASTAMSSFEGRPALRATVIFNCTLYPQTFEKSELGHIQMSGSGQVFFQKPQ